MICKGRDFSRAFKFLSCEKSTSAAVVVGTWKCDTIKHTVVLITVSERGGTILIAATAKRQNAKRNKVHVNYMRESHQ